MRLNSAKFKNLSCRVILIVIDLDQWKTWEALLGIASHLDQDVSLGFQRSKS